MSSSSDSSIRICISAADTDGGLFPVPAVDVEAPPPAAEVLGPEVGLFKPEVLGPEEVLGPGDVADDAGVVLGIFRFCVSSFEAFLRLRICFCKSSRIRLIDFNLII